MEEKLPNFFELVTDDLALVEKTMRDSRGQSHPDLEAALDHLLSSGGKRIRPTLVLLSGKMLNTPPDRLLVMASSIELLHNATLVHDDFIDGALLRRGVPTLSSKWSSGATVLTGDYFFAKAALFAAESGSVDILQIFARALMNIVVGEITQLFGSTGKDLTDNYYDRIKAKTATLFEVACQTPALLAGCTEETVQAMSTFGNDLGIAFQIIDDVMDFVAEAESIGKPVAEDLRNGILTLPAIIYLEENTDHDMLNKILNHEKIAEEIITGLVLAIRQSDAIEKACQAAQEYTHSAINAIDIIPHSKEKDALIELAHYVTARKI